MSYQVTKVAVLPAISCAGDVKRPTRMVGRASSSPPKEAVQSISSTDGMKSMSLKLQNRILTTKMNRASRWDIIEVTSCLEAHVKYSNSDGRRDVSHSSPAIFGSSFFPVPSPCCETLFQCLDLPARCRHQLSQAMFPRCNGSDWIALDLLTIGS